ncbi:hypothetical protein ABZP36_026012 [Zizania latifolia]
MHRTRGAAAARRVAAKSDDGQSGACTAYGPVLYFFSGYIFLDLYFLPAMTTGSGRGGGVAEARQKEAARASSRTSCCCCGSGPLPRRAMASGGLEIDGHSIGRTVSGWPTVGPTTTWVRVVNAGCGICQMQDGFVGRGSA